MDGWVFKFPDFDIGDGHAASLDVGFLGLAGLSPGKVPRRVYTRACFLQEIICI